MIKSLLVWAAFMLLNFCTYSQITDTIRQKNYTAYVSRQIGEPMFVVYKLYKGGGQCSRKGFYFKNDWNINLKGDSEYKGSGYDKGHLANAEDFAFDCELDELTFRYYNCIPQTPNLNRGIWKMWETKLREQSQNDSLLILAGGIWSGAYENNLPIPGICWKVVKNLRTKKIEHIMLFTNDMQESIMTEVSRKSLEGLLMYKLPIK